MTRAFWHPARAAFLLLSLATSLSLSGLPSPAATPSPVTINFFLHSGATDFLDQTTPTSATAKSKVSPSLDRNNYRTIGLWSAAPRTSATQILGATALQTWVGVTDVKDRPVRFDFRAELLKNGVVIASGESLSNNQLLADATKAKQLSISFTSLQTTSLAIGDVLSLRILAKESGKGKKSSTGQVVVYYDSTVRPAQFGVSLPANNPPLVNAGPDQTVFVGDTVTLDGSASSDADGDPLTFNWAFVSRPGGSVAVLSNSTAVNPTFLVDRPGSYTIRLIVNDGKADSVTADIVVVSTFNSRPVGNAGPDQTSFVGNTVTLDGSASSDFDGDPLTYRWSLVSSPSGSTAALQNATSAKPTFVVDKFGDYEVQLIVNDGLVDSVPATVKISTLNSAPVAKAGANQTALVGDLITLDGSGSTDIDGNALTYRWSLTVKPTDSTATLENPFNVNPTFVIDKPGDYVVQLIVNDGTVDSAPSTVKISTTNSPPVANAGADQVVFVGDLIQLNGSGSTDVDGDLLGFAWSIIVKPQNSQALLSNPFIVNPTFTVDVAGDYVVQLIATDGTVNSKPSTVTISTQNRPPVANAGVAQTVALNATVQLDGSGSSDPDGDVLAFSWSLLSKPTGSVAALSNVNIAKPTFVADQAGAYVAQLIVSDGKINSAPATVAISTDDSIAIANAGPDQTVPAGSTVQLDGSASFDPDGAQLFYAWSFTTLPPGSSATLSNPSVVNPTFLADKRGTYVGQLIVGDGTLVSAPDTVMITATNRAPIAQDDTATTSVNTAVIVNVLSNDSDSDGDPLTVTSVSQPANGKVVANANNTATYTPAAGFTGSDSFTYAISDGQSGTAGATVRVTVNPIFGCPAPIITSIDPLSGPVGTEITITGTNLDCGNTRTLTLNGIQLIITSLTPTQIKTFIPIGGQDGLFTLATDGGSVTQQQLAYDVVLSQDFQLNVLPPSTSVMQGSSTSYVVELASIGSTPFTGTAALSASGLPTGASVFFSPAVVTAGQKATLTVTTSGTTPLGISSFQINAGATIDAQVTVKTATAQLQVLPSGTTALAGSVLDTEGNPIAGVTIRIGSIPSKFEAVTNQAGSFLLLDPPVGTQLVFVDGQTVANIKYPTIPINVTIVAGTVNQLPFTPFLHAQNDQNFIQIDPSKDTIVTDPALPGVTLRIPAGTQIIGWDGQPNQKVSMRAVPVDRLPIPPPPPEVLANVVYMFYFGKVGGGTPTQPIPFSAPNDLGMEPGEKAELWYFDESPVPGEAPNDWRMAGLGTVSADGTTIVSDPGVGIPKFCCGAAAYNKRLASHDQVPGQSPQAGAGQSGGDPVDLSTGIFMLTETDMVLPGRIPLVVTRSYRSGDIAFGPFGRGTTMSYDDILPLTAPGVLTYVYRGSARTQFFLQGDGSYRNNAIPAFRGARITINASTGVRTLRHRNGASIDFDTNGLMLAVRDRNGNQVTISRSGLKANRITDPVNRSLTFTQSGILETSLTDPLGRTVRYEYDGAARLIKVTKPDGSITQYGYDSAHRMTSITDGRGITYLKNSYDVNSRVCQQEQADGGKYKIYYVTTDRASFPDSIQLLQQAASGGPISIAPCSSTFSTGIVTATVLVDPLGRPTTYRFNSLGFLISMTNALGQTTSMFRDSSTNQVISSTDPLGRTARFEYNSVGNLTKVTDPAGNISLVEYDPIFNKVTKTTDPLGNVTTFEYDNKGNVIAFIDPEQNLKPPAQRLKTIIAYNSFGQPIGTTDVLGNAAKLDYDSLGNLSTITDPLGNTTRRNFDLVSRLITQTDPRGKTTRFAYDGVNRITQIVDAMNGFTNLSYDANGNLLTVTDARGNSTAHTYDTMDRLANRVDQLKRSEIFNYDLNGNLIQATNRNGQISTFQYDALNRRIGGSYADGTSVQYQLDSVGRLVRATDSVGGDTLFNYDNLDRLIVANAELGTIGYAYDKAGRRTSMTVSGQPTVTYSYDANSRLLQVLRGNQATNLSYDALNRRTKLTLPNGVYTEYSYDAASRLTELIYKNFLGTLLGNITYQYDGAGNRRGAGGSLAQTLLPDAVSSAHYDAANRQLHFGDNTMSYDPAGNLSTLVGPTGTTTLTWDARQRLSSIGGTSVTGVFSYDALGRRRSKQINGQFGQDLYDAFTSISEKANNSTNTFVTSLSLDELFQRNTNEFYLADAIGSIVGLTDASGIITNRYSYEPFGNTVQQGSSLNTFQFTSRENDNTGFYYYRARYYSPVLHRFISEDPIGLLGGDTNYYSYVFNSPIFAGDPLGLKPANPPNSNPPGGAGPCGASTPQSGTPSIQQIAQGIGNYAAGGANIVSLWLASTVKAATYGLGFIAKGPLKIPVMGLRTAAHGWATIAAEKAVKDFREGTDLLFPDPPQQPPPGSCTVVTPDAVVFPNGYGFRVNGDWGSIPGW